MRYEYPSCVIGKGSSIISITLECKKCGLKFVFERPNGDYLAKLVEVDGVKVKWLPIYGKGGYIELEEKLTTEYAGVKKTGKVSFEIGETVKKKLPRYTEKGPLGNGFTVGGYIAECPLCKSKEFEEIESKIIEEPKLDWVKISVDLLKEV